MGIVMPYQSKTPQLGKDVFLAPTAAIVGDVTIGECSSIWFSSVVRGDYQPVRIGSYSNVQDNATVHVMGDAPTEIGDYVIIGHNALIHSRRIGNHCLIGMGSILLGYTEIGENCIIGAGTLLPQRKKIPSNSLVYGNPAKIVRSLREDEIEALHESALNCHDFAKKYMEEIEKLKGGNF